MNAYIKVTSEKIVQSSMVTREFSIGSQNTLELEFCEISKACTVHKMDWKCYKGRRVGRVQGKEAAKDI